MSVARAAAALSVLLAASGAWAVDSAPPLADAALQKRYLELTHELRCVQCQNESIADSPVEIAGDLRREVRERLVAGMSNQQIRDLMVSRYGEFILFRPRWSARNALLWLAPALLLLGGMLIAWRVVKQRGAMLPGDTAEVGVDDDSAPR
jgi:cytochrome c-type biogenesis protein CcmH